jgi:hypothetical protein
MDNSGAVMVDQARGVKESHKKKDESQNAMDDIRFSYNIRRSYGRKRNKDAGITSEDSRHNRFDSCYKGHSLTFIKGI